jgi:hypothetical protein
MYSDKHSNLLFTAVKSFITKFVPNMLSTSQVFTNDQSHKAFPAVIYKLHSVFYNVQQFDIVKVFIYKFFSTNKLS